MTNIFHTCNVLIIIRIAYFVKLFKRKTVETAQRAVALAQSAYTNGQATYLNVMDAQDKLDMVWLNFVNVNFEYLSAYYDWELAVGVK
jgi:outer membrane protein TolC